VKLPLSERVLAELRERKAVRAGDAVGVAVSGGGDSVALLRLLLDLRDRVGICLTVVHFNHRIRSEESDLDEEFVASLASEHSLDFWCGTEDVPGSARRNGWNLEDAARRLRYEFFGRAVKEGRVASVAVAHTADDQAETVLAHILRGTGVTGLGGIYPSTKEVIRPLLFARRKELRDYLIQLGQSWREDSTNQDTSRLRARIRLSLIPALEREFQPSVVEQLCGLSSLARNDEAFWNRLVFVVFSSATKESSGPTISISVANLLDPLRLRGTDEGGIASLDALSSRTVRRIVEELRGSREQLTSRHVEQVIRLATECESGAEVHLPGVLIVRDFDRLTFSRVGSNAQPYLASARTAAPFAYPVELGDHGSTEIVIPEIERRVRLKVVDWSDSTRETTAGQGALDRDRLQVPLVFRSWLPGDSFRPPGRRHVRKLKRLLLELRISRRDRVGWPVLTSGGVLVWVRGFPPAAGFAAAAGTRHGVVIEEEPL